MTVPVSSVSAMADALPAEPATASPSATSAASPPATVTGDPTADRHRRRRDGILAVLVLVLAVAATLAVLVPLWMRPASGTLAP